MKCTIYANDGKVSKCNSHLRAERASDLFWIHAFLIFFPWLVCSIVSRCNTMYEQTEQQKKKYILSMLSMVLLPNNLSVCMNCNSDLGKIYSTEHRVLIFPSNQVEMNEKKKDVL